MPKEQEVINKQTLAELLYDTKYQLIHLNKNIDKLNEEMKEKKKTSDCMYPEVKEEIKELKEKKLDTKQFYSYGAFFLAIYTMIVSAVTAVINISGK